MQFEQLGCMYDSRCNSNRRATRLHVHSLLQARNKLSRINPVTRLFMCSLLQYGNARAACELQHVQWLANSVEFTELSWD